MISGAIPIFCKISTESLILPLQRKIKVRENSFSEIIFYAMSELLYNAFESNMFLFTHDLLQAEKVLSRILCGDDDVHCYSGFL